MANVSFTTKDGKKVSFRTKASKAVRKAAKVTFRGVTGKARGGKRKRRSTAMAKGKGRRRSTKKGGGRRRSGMRLSLIGSARKVAKINPFAEALLEAAPAAQGGDFAGAAIAGYGAVSGNLTGYNQATQQWEPQRLVATYVPPLVVEGINAGLHAVKSFARGFGSSAPAV